MQVIAALSGGVDSAVAAARLVAAGHQVTGVHLALSRVRGDLRSGARGCCTIEDSRDAWRAADLLGIPFYVWDLSEEFAAAVVDDFVNEYAMGRTPNPCLRCNEQIKFAAVLDRAMDLGFDAVGTGHYAQVRQGPSGPELHRAADPDKDQSYVLGVLTPEQIAHSMFPLGDTHKVDVRKEAAALGLQVAAKPDSHDICFIPDGDTAGYLRSQLPDAPGEIRDAQTGEVLGEHSGAFQYTVGQRRGLNLGRPAADGARRYVVSVDVASSTVLVGPPRLLSVDRLECDHVLWAGPVPEHRFRAAVQVRAHGSAYPAWVVPARGRPDQPERLEIALDGEILGVAPGQSAVLYDGTRVIGSGTVAATGRRPRNPS